MNLKTDRDILGKMLDIWIDDPAPQTYSAVAIARMAKCLHIAVDACLAPISEKELDLVCKGRGISGGGQVIAKEAIQAFCALRHIRILSSPEPSLKDRIKPILDKWFNQPCDTDTMAEEIAALVKERGE